jgi:acylphosphatase
MAPYGTGGEALVPADPHRNAKTLGKRCDNPTMPELLRRRVVVHGRVQGVFFRDTTRERARAYGVAGWVRNRPDGAVEAVLEGPPEAVDRVARFLEIGPPHAHVEHVEAHDEEPEGLNGFSIR